MCAARRARPNPTRSRHLGAQMATARFGRAYQFLRTSIPAVKSALAMAGTVAEGSRAPTNHQSLLTSHFSQRELTPAHLRKIPLLRLLIFPGNTDRC
jgi:hypothetical protein